MYKKELSRLCHLALMILWGINIVSASPSEATIEQILASVDDALAKSSEYEQTKLNNIDALKLILKETEPNSEERYNINQALFTEYYSFVCDSALHYLENNLEVAKYIGREDLVMSTLISKAQVISKAGLFYEAMKILDKIDPKKLDKQSKTQYFNSYNSLYQFLIEYEGANNEYSIEYRALANMYKDSVLSMVEPTSFNAISIMGSRLMDDMKFNEGIRLLESHLPEYKRGTREYSILASILAFGYLRMNKQHETIYYYAQSAISDIEGVIKENMAIRALAEAVFNEGELERANKYIQKSIDDANYYTARMRKNQSALMLPIISRSFQATQEEANRQLAKFFIIIASLAVGLIVSICYIIRQLKIVKASRRIISDSKDELQELNKELTEANRAFEITNRELSEVNYIKEEYLGRFLMLCSKYISTLEQYRKMLYQQAASGKIEELHHSLKSKKIINDTLDEFYSAFDSAFLNIFPDFIERINMMLLEGGKIELRGDEKLNTELRIFALIRLGVNDSNKIANFLRCSITTIYTYRSKIKNRSALKGDFEKEIMKISSI
ncbi:MAG: hypothetical protein IKL83_05955 [Muribaculaceae bacterium]|nr:hypothetical protein [Muribaculaceae bacterium]